MGVVRDVAGVAQGKTEWVSEKAAEKVNGELERVKTALEFYMKYLNELSLVSKAKGVVEPLVESALATVQHLLASLANSKTILYSREKLYGIHCYLCRQMDAILIKLAEFTMPPLTYGHDLLREAHCRLLNLVINTFDKIDEDLVSPLYYTTRDGSLVVIEKSTKASQKAIDLANSAVIEPTKLAVKNRVVDPMKAQATSTKSCMLSTGAWVDEKCSLSEMLFRLVQTSKKYDSEFLGGWGTTKAGEALSLATKADEKLFDGGVVKLAEDTLEEYQKVKKSSSSGCLNVPVVVPGKVMAAEPSHVEKKVKAPSSSKNKTSVGAPVY